MEFVTMYLAVASLRELFTSIQPYVVVFNGVLGVVIGFMTLYLLVRTRPRKIKSRLLKPGAVIINWSGHPLPEAPWLVPFKVWNPDTPPSFNVESWDNIRASVSKILYGLPRDLQLRLLQGDNDVIIVIPQLAAGLSVLLATLHGLMGVFPSITSPLRKADGSFWLPDPVSLGEIRLQSRENRDFGE